MERPVACAGYDSYCRFATLANSWDEYHQIQNDLSEAMWFCSLYNEPAWGESPICTNKDWEEISPNPEIENLEFHNHLSYSYIVKKEGCIWVGRCLEFPEVNYEDKYGCEESCLAELQYLVFRQIEKLMQEKKLLPKPIKREEK